MISAETTCKEALGHSRVSPAAQRGDLRRDWRPGSTQLATCGSHPLAEQRKRPGLTCAMWTSSHQTEKAIRAAAHDQTQPGRRAQQGRKEPSAATLPQSTGSTEPAELWPGLWGAVSPAQGSGLWGSVWSLGESPDSPTEAWEWLFPGWFWILTHHHLETGLGFGHSFPYPLLPVMIIWYHSQQAWLFCFTLILPVSFYNSTVR